MNEQIFVKRSHKDTKTALIVLYVCLFIVGVFGVLVNDELIFEIIAFLIVAFILFLYLIKLFNTFGVYVKDKKKIYKTFKRKEIDIYTIIGVKIIKAEGQVNLAWSSFDIKDNKGNALYSMIFLSNFENEMEKYPYGDLEFMRKYKKSIIMYSIYDERLIEFLKEHISTFKIIGPNN